MFALKFLDSGVKYTGQFTKKLDVDPQRDDNTSPMSSWYRFTLRPTWMISALWHKSKYKSKIQFWTFLKKKIKFLCFHVVVPTREDLSIDVSITNVGLILTKLWRFQLFSTSQNRLQVRIQFQTFWKIQIFVFPCCSSYLWRPFHWCINY